MSLKKHKQLRSLEHLRFVRSKQCAIQGMIGDSRIHVCSGPIQAAHIRMGTDGGTGKKPSDNFTIPLCAKAHHEQGQIGEGAFEKRYLLNTKNVAECLWLDSPVNNRRVEWKKLTGII